MTFKITMVKQEEESYREFLTVVERKMQILNDAGKDVISCTVSGDEKTFFIVTAEEKD